jgi:hypothetical protein
VDVGVLGEAGGEHAARRPSSDDDDVEALVHGRIVPSSATA